MERADRVPLQKDRQIRNECRRKMKRSSILFIFVIAYFTNQAFAGFDAELKTRLLRKVREENLSRKFLHTREPTSEKPSDKTDKIDHSNTMSLGLRWTLLIPIVFHRKIITHQDAPSCTFIPSCSAYGYEAIKRHRLLGILMTADRLLRCHGGNRQNYPSIGNYAYDPVEKKTKTRKRDTPSEK